MKNHTTWCKSQLQQLIGMAQMGIHDFQKMQNSNSAIPIYFSGNANRNARGKAEDEHGREGMEGRPAFGWLPLHFFLLCSSSARGPLDISVCISGQINGDGRIGFLHFFENQESPFVPSP